ncbi:uncharacterized protein LOC102156858 isoform X7 [Canis lupus familiaris]|uniref:uncharacterized protein LOC102156858 isoform X7 n=1 Tax=Canis lupus familiaris TaxID=9615 RepID=UPI0018F33326|nr:uncharacterized protein LOC102156858 isoform X7 [Canis lupus familiaris]
MRESGCRPSKRSQGVSSTRSVLRVLSPEGQEYAAECLESISVLPVPQPHTGRPLPGEITSPCCHCHRRRLRDHEPLQTPTQFSGIERMHTLLHNYHHHPFPGLFPSSKLCLAIDGQEQPPTNPILSSSEKGQRKDEANGRGERAQFLKAILEGNWTDNSLLGPTRPQLDRGEIISHIYSQPICITGAKTHTREKIVSLINGAG